jgi:surface antigen
MRSAVVRLALAFAFASPVAAQDACAGVVEFGYPYAGRCPGAGLAERVDRWDMYECNCTSYVAWALNANDQRTDWFIAGSMDARNWPHVARLRGIRVGRRPRVGAVAVWEHASKFGHVAYVTKVEAGGAFDVAEYNLPGLGPEAFAFDTRDDVSAAGVLFIYVPRRPR